ncbi:10331_t:CDS:2, partial [Funneliformis caledonium]
KRAEIENDDENGYDEGGIPLSDPDVCATLMEIYMAEEIKEILRDDTTRQITYEDLDKFTYLNAIIKESQRVISLAPFTLRKVILVERSDHKIVKNTYSPFGGL